MIRQRVHIEELSIMITGGASRQSAWGFIWYLVYKGLEVYTGVRVADAWRQNALRRKKLECSRALDLFDSQFRQTSVDQARENPPQDRDVYRLVLLYSCKLN